MDAYTVAAADKSLRDLVIEYIDHILDRKKWTGTDLARKAGMSPSTILRLLNDKNYNFIPTMKTLRKIADTSGYPIPRKVLDGIGASRDEDATSASEARTRRRTSGGGSVELKYFSSLPPALQSSTAPKATPTTVTAPAQLDGDDTLFGFYMFNDELAPVVSSGALMFGTKRRDPANGDTVLVTDKNGRSKIRFLMSITENGLKMSRSLPAKEDETISFDEIGDMAIVAGWVARM